jgi:hypothetical protein
MNLSPTAWIVIGLFALLIIALNISLLAALRHKKGGGQPFLGWQKAVRTLRQPWQKEDEQLSELNRLVSDLPHPAKHEDHKV